MKKSKKKDVFEQVYNEICEPVGELKKCNCEDINIKKCIHKMYVCCHNRKSIFCYQEVNTRECMECDYYEPIDLYENLLYRRQ